MRCARYPVFVLTGWSEEGFAEIPCWHPAVDQVILLRSGAGVNIHCKPGAVASGMLLKSVFMSEKYDLVIDAQGLLKSAWLTRGFKVPVVGFDRQSAREPIASYFYDRPICVAREQHAVERVRQLFAQALGYALPKHIGEYSLQRERLAGAQQHAPYVLFLHGTTWPSKHWPPTSWRALAEHLSKQGVAVRISMG